ncbi:MAG: uracil phosphoribosyltransferase [Verrucomicrobiota bacterium]
MPLKTLQHALVEEHLAVVRDVASKQAHFKRSADILATALALELSADLKTLESSVETPLETTAVKRLASAPVLIPILRAGLSMLEPFRSLLPDSPVGFIGQERDEETAEAHTYYFKAPSLDGQTVFLLDPMLATGGSAIGALERVYASQPGRVKFACVVAAPEGVDAIKTRFPSVEIIACALDRCLNEKAYICPGLGDFGDRLMGT